MASYLDDEGIRRAVDGGLPRAARWIVRGEAMDLEFGGERFGARRMMDTDVVGGALPEGWSEFHLSLRRRVEPVFWRANA